MAAGRAELADRTSIGLRLRDRYRIVTLLGRGALGEVAVAEDEVTGERVAVRLLPRGLSAEAVQRSRRSIVAASAAHPAFIRVLDSGETSDGRSFVVMELAEGRGLNEELADHEPLEIRDALRLALDLGGAIETLHNLGIVHAAVRPCNVRILAQGRLKLMDLEVAGLRGAPEMREALAESAPAEYLAPEQVRGNTLTDRTDVYAFGLTLYELLCGAPPFRNVSREAVLSAQLDEAPWRIRRRRRGVPKGVQTLLSRALAKEPESRPFMSNLLNDLDDAASQPVTSWKRVAGVVGGVLVLASMAIPFMWDAFTPQPDAPQPPTSPPAAVAPAVPVVPEPATTEAPPADAPSTPVAAPSAAALPTPSAAAVPATPPAASAPAETLPNPAAATPPPAPTATLPPGSAAPLPAAPKPDASVSVPTKPRRPPVMLPPATTPAATARDTTPSAPPPSVNATPPASSAPAPPPVLPERRAPAPARTEARPTPARASSIPERPAAPAERRVTTPERPSTATDDADGGAAIDWLLKRPGTSNR